MMNLRMTVFAVLLTADVVATGVTPVNLSVKTNAKVLSRPLIESTIIGQKETMVLKSNAKTSAEKKSSGESKSRAESPQTATPTSVFPNVPTQNTPAPGGESDIQVSTGVYTGPNGYVPEGDRPAGIAGTPVEDYWNTIDTVIDSLSDGLDMSREEYVDSVLGKLEKKDTVLDWDVEDVYGNNGSFTGKITSWSVDSGEQQAPDLTYEVVSGEGNVDLTDDQLTVSGNVVVVITDQNSGETFTVDLSGSGN